MRRLLHAAAWITAIASAAIAIVGAWVFTQAETTTAGRLSFEQPLRIPPLLEPRTDVTGRKVFDLRLQAGRSQLRPGTTTETWGVNGPHLGPTLRASRGDRVLMKVHNALAETTTLHWHGMQLPARADGGPHQPIRPGATWMPSWRIDQPAATLWYHPHQMGSTEDHVYRGLAGMWIIEDPAAARLGLPHTYGVDDIPLILQDKRLTDEGHLDFSRGAFSPTGRLGDHVLVNGTYEPHLVVRDRLVRFRILNASTARVYAVGFADGRRFDLIATDGGLLDRPARLRRIRLSPGERAEIVARLVPGERTVLRSFPPDLHTDLFHERFSGGDDTLDLLELRAAKHLRSSREIPPDLAEPTTPAARPGDRTRRFRLSGSRRINGRTMDPTRLDAVLERGGHETWIVRNEGNTPHNFHIHGVQFRILEYAGGPTPPELAGRKDTVYVPPGSSIRLAVAVGPYADPSTPYMFHCHLLQHEDRGMMGQFIVAGRGDRSRESRRHRHGAEAAGDG